MATTTTSGTGTPLSERPWWPWAKRLGGAAFLAVVAYLLVTQARAMEWGRIFDAMRDYPAAVMAGAVGLGLLSHAIYATFDLIGRHHTGHTLPVPTVMAITFVSYVFNLNMGALVGGVGMRVRLYTRLGLDGKTVTRIVGTSMVTNWLGYLLLGGVAFAVWPPALPEGWKVGTLALRGIGAAMVALALAYVLMAAFARRREWQWRGHTLALPSLRVALLQLALSCTNWAVMAGALWVLMQGEVAYPQVLTVLLVAAVAGVISHVPAGLGVLEAVVLALLAAGPLARNELMAAVLAYRAAYYWLPLAFAALLYLGMELSARKLRAGSPR